MPWSKAKIERMLKKRELDNKYNTADRSHLKLYQFKSNKTHTETIFKNAMVNEMKNRGWVNDNTKESAKPKKKLENSHFKKFIQKVQEETQIKYNNELSKYQMNRKQRRELERQEK